MATHFWFAWTSSLISNNKKWRFFILGKIFFGHAYCANCNLNVISNNLISFWLHKLFLENQFTFYRHNTENCLETFSKVLCYTNSNVKFAKDIRKNHKIETLFSFYMLCSKCMFFFWSYDVSVASLTLKIDVLRCKDMFERKKKIHDT